MHITVPIDARGAWFDEFGADQLARRIQRSFWKHVGFNKDSSYSQARGSTGQKV
jgi:hypothetical protein